MPATVSIPNFETSNIYNTSELSTDVAAGATSFAVENPSNFPVQLFAFIGVFGQKTADFLTIQSVTGSSVTPSTPVVRSHVRFDPVSVLRANKFKVYRATDVDNTAPADAAFTYLTTVDMDPSELSTYYIDMSGSSSYWYKVTYFNSLTSTESSLTNSTAVRGDNTIGYCSIDSIREEAGFSNNRNISDALIDQKRQLAMDRVNGGLGGVYTVPFAIPVHPFIAEITRQYAAGSLLIKDYGTAKAFSTNEGKAKMDWADAQIKLLKSKELVLYDANGADVSIPNAGGFSMWPDETTADAAEEDGGGARKFTSLMRY